MRRAEVSVSDTLAGYLCEERKNVFTFTYAEGYQGSPVSLALPVRAEPYAFEEFPPFFDGLLPEGIQLESLLRQEKLDRDDYFAQLMCVGEELVGDVSVRPAS